MTRKELIQAVSARMDEITPDSDVIVSVSGSDNNPLYTLIDTLVDEGVQELFSTAPYWRLPQKSFPSEGSCLISPVFAAPFSRIVLRIRLPEDFLRLAEIECSKLSRPITEVFSEDSDTGKRQHNKILVAKLDKPIALMSFGKWKNSDLVREIDCYSFPVTEMTSHLTADTDDAGMIRDAVGSMTATYIGKPAAIGADTDVTNVVPEVLIPALSWLLAGKTFSAMGDTNRATLAIQNEQNLMM